LEENNGDGQTKCLIDVKERDGSIEKENKPHVTYLLLGFGMAISCDR
jgi:hypothetical protein